MIRVPWQMLAKSAMCGVAGVLLHLSFIDLLIILFGTDVIQVLVTRHLDAGN